MTRELRPDLRLASGYRKVSGGKHVRIKNAEGKTVATVSSTPGRGRALANEQALIKRLGIDAVNGRRRGKPKGDPLSDKEWGWFNEALAHYGGAGIYARAVMEIGGSRGMRLPKSHASLQTTINRIHRDRSARVSSWMRDLILLGSDYLPRMEPPKRRRRRGSIRTVEEAGIRGAEAATTRIVREHESIARLAAQVAELEGRVHQLEDVLTRPPRDVLRDLARAVIELTGE